MNKTLKLALVAGTVLFTVPSYGMFSNIRNLLSKLKRTSFSTPISTPNKLKQKRYFRLGTCREGCFNKYCPMDDIDFIPHDYKFGCKNNPKCRNPEGLRRFGWLFFSHADFETNYRKKKIEEIKKTMRNKHEHKEYLNIHLKYYPGAEKNIKEQNNIDRQRIKAIKEEIRHLDNSTTYNEDNGDRIRIGRTPFAENSVIKHFKSGDSTKKPKPKEYSKEAFKRRCARYKELKQQQKIQEKKIQEKKIQEKKEQLLVITSIKS